MKERYVDGPRFHRPTQQLILQCNDILKHYESLSVPLTVRQLFYCLVRRDAVGNSKRDYDNFARTLTHARLAGEIDWDMIVDPTRSVLAPKLYKGPSHALKCLSNTYSEDLWIDQDSRVIVAVEKETLLGIAQRACGHYGVPIMHTRGYPSATSMRAFVKQHIMEARQQNCVVLLLANHASVGLDLERDLEERIEVFNSGKTVVVERVALDKEQIEDWQVPSMFGGETYELEAADPVLIASELHDSIKAQCSDSGALEERYSSMMHYRAAIQQLAMNL